VPRRRLASSEQGHCLESRLCPAQPEGQRPRRGAQTKPNPVQAGHRRDARRPFIWRTAEPNRGPSWTCMLRRSRKIRPVRRMELLRGTGLDPQREIAQSPRKKPQGQSSALSRRAAARLPLHRRLAPHRREKPLARRAAHPCRGERIRVKARTLQAAKVALPGRKFSLTELERRPLDDEPIGRPPSE
jgi:hypothetical protein